MTAGQVTDGGEVCAVCGQEESPEKGWIYRSSEVEPVGIQNGEMKFEAKEGANQFCSTDCLDEFKQEDEA